MRILVYPHDLGIGGSQLNAIELAAAVQRLGHEVIVFGRPGALLSRVNELGLEFVESPQPGKRPSLAVAGALGNIVRSRGIDVIHGYEWPPTLEGLVTMWRGADVRVVSTIMSMSVPPFIPRHTPMIVGTEQIAAAERNSRRAEVSVIEPPVDLVHNSRSATSDVSRFRTKFGVDSRRLNIVCVTRFARELKLEGVLTAIDVVADMSTRVPIRLVLVGDGPDRRAVEARAQETNERHGGGTVILTGQLPDPRPAYASADIALGMGGSALRALAFGAPLIVQGERGFWRRLSPETADDFLWTGWYGVGAGEELGHRALTGELESLLDAESRHAAGHYGLALVRQRFSLDRAAGMQEQVYVEAVNSPNANTRLDNLRAFGQYSQYYFNKRMQRLLGREATDDFNARPVAATEKRTDRHA